MSNDNIKTKALWGENVLFPGFYGFVPNEEAWDFEMERLHVDDPPDYPDADGRCTTFDYKGRFCCLVTIGEHIDEKHADDPASVAGLIAHEAMHVWRHIRLNAGEETPSVEVEAYAMQRIFMNLYEAYLTSRQRKIKDFGPFPLDNRAPPPFTKAA